MASISVPCPKCSPISPLNKRPVASRILSFASIKGPNQRNFPILKAQAHEGPNQRNFPILKAQAHEVAVENSLNSSSPPSAKSNDKVAEAVDESAKSEVPESVMTSFMAEVSDLVKLVDSRDIIELQLKQKDCELIIRKKEALPQPVPPPFVMMQPSPQAMYAPPPPFPGAAPPPTPSAPSPAASAPALLAPPMSSKSSHTPFKCPMSGTFYRSPAPGEPPFVKVGEKVKKGQVICIIEAMKLMNEIETDQSGTVVDIPAEDGKPVSVDTPLFVIEP